ncbi:hypothetical protein BOTCAL_0298g00010 [Botryotinia calthae]|uniref:Uncharacterized protein n=1 Tax=Botryotinia calthae TaxID=38488 RepID=A0A4Y8CXB9_9HELO|nr:hypothetical protein BOTCAL_0298g00010 [Botryotinia calthae]
MDSRANLVYGYYGTMFSSHVYGSAMYNIASTTGIGYTKSILEVLTNIQLGMKTRNRKTERNPLAAFIAIVIFSLIVIITIIFQLRNFLLNNKSLHRIPETTQPNRDPNPLTPYAHLKPPQPNKQKIINYFNPRFQDIPDLHILRRQVRENIDAIFVGAVVPWPEILEAGFGYGALAVIDREVKLQGGRGEDVNETREMGKEAHPRDRDVDTPDWMLALFPKPEHEDENENENADKSPQKKGEEKPREQKSTFPISSLL